MISHSSRTEGFGLSRLASTVSSRKTVPFASLCAQIKGLSGLTESDQMCVLQRVKPTSRPRSPIPQRPVLLAALITTDAGTMHPLYPRLADHAGHPLPQQADSVWTDTIKILQDRYCHR